MPSSVDIQRHLLYQQGGTVLSWQLPASGPQALFAPPPQSSGQSCQADFGRPRHPSARNGAVPLGSPGPKHRDSGGCSMAPARSHYSPPGGATTGAVLLDSVSPNHDFGSRDSSLDNVLPPLQCLCVGAGG
ncbi:hypothetical protein AAFF_G00411720 [Aldrovandia affinis]|uniref:Uncharacterized protein n=1 Tax=Aldrovandia affinis TaxID=143900 RepID=A0AAD7SBF2_9TELE|nr:hypothetical protein AAFF_G00411720 [Aldrovandia affinis]